MIELWLLHKIRNFVYAILLSQMLNNNTEIVNFTKRRNLRYVMKHDEYRFTSRTNIK